LRFFAWADCVFLPGQIAFFCLGRLRFFAWADCVFLPGQIAFFCLGRLRFLPGQIEIKDVIVKRTKI